MPTIDRSSALCALALLAPPAMPGARGADANAEPYRRYEFILDRAAPNGEDVRLQFHAAGGALRSGFALVPWVRGSGEESELLGHSPHFIRVERQRTEGNRTEAQLVLFGHATQPAKPPLHRWSIAFSQDAAGIAGEYRVDWGRLAPGESRGRLTGRARAEPDLRAGNEFAPGHDWPCHRGPACDGRAPAGSRALVDDLSHARLAWISEEPTPGAYDQGVHGGFNAPVVSAGQVYLSCFQGVGECQTTNAWDAFVRGKGSRVPEENRRTFAVEAEDIVVCADAATGGTRWVFRMPGALNPRLPEAHHTTCSVASNRVFAVGVTGRVFCLDAQTGEPLWIVETPVSTAFAMRRPGLKAERMQADFKSSCSPPQVCDGVLLTTDGYKGAFCAYDIRDGQRLWSVPHNGFGRWQGVTRWECGGRVYAITGSGHCFEPRTGRLVWGLKEETDGSFLMMGVCGNILVAYVKDPRGRKVPAWVAPVEGGPRDLHVLTGFRISPEGAKPIWRHPELASWWDLTYHAPTAGANGLFVWGMMSVNGSPFDRKTLVCLEPNSGRILGSADWGWAGSFDIWTGGKLIGHRGTELAALSPGESRIQRRPMDPRLRFPFVESTNVSYADGRLLGRLNRGIVCWDLRKEPAQNE